MFAKDVNDFVTKNKLDNTTNRKKGTVYTNYIIMIHVLAENPNSRFDHPRYKFRKKDLREITYIDRALISLFIKEVPNQTLNELAFRIAIECCYRVSDVIDYLKDIGTLGYFVQHSIDEYYLEKWTPGYDQSQYDRYKFILDNFLITP